MSVVLRALDEKMYEKLKHIYFINEEINKLANKILDKEKVTSQFINELFNYTKGFPKELQDRLKYKYLDSLLSEKQLVDCISALTNISDILELTQKLENTNSEYYIIEKNKYALNLSAPRLIFMIQQIYEEVKLYLFNTVSQYLFNDEVTLA